MTTRVLVISDTHVPIRAEQLRELGHGRPLRLMISTDLDHYPYRPLPEIVPVFVELEVAVPRLMPASR